MRKLLFAAALVTVVALQPTLATAQRSPGPAKFTFSGSTATVSTFGTFNILQVIPATASAAGLPALPAGIRDTSSCLQGTPAGGVVAAGVNPTITFVGNVLCLDPGPLGDFASFAVGCPAGQTPVVEGIKLIKTEQKSPKCPDVYPGGTWVQTPASTGIRTWWPLKYTPCETTFQLRVEFACLAPASGGDTRPQVRSIREAVWNFKVTLTAATLSWVLQALHVQPLGTLEVPCITDESLFNLLLTQADAIRNAAAALPTTGGTSAQTLALNTAIDNMEATIVLRCNFLVSVGQPVRDSAGNITGFVNVLFPNNGPWGNFTVSGPQPFGWGIVDTFEHPCCCKLITDLFWLKMALIGNNDP